MLNVTVYNIHYCEQIYKKKKKRKCTSDSLTSTEVGIFLSYIPFHLVLGNNVLFWLALHIVVTVSFSFVFFLESLDCLSFILWRENSMPFLFII